MIGNLNKDVDVIYHPIKDFLFNQYVDVRNEVIHIVFQPSSQTNIFSMIVDADEDYELSLMIDTIIQHALYKIEKTPAKYRKDYNYLRQKLIMARKKKGLHKRNEGESDEERRTRIKN